MRHSRHAPISALRPVVLSLLVAMALVTPAVAQDDPVLAVVALTNNAREAEGIPPLTASSTLTQAAQFHAEWMSNSGCFAHSCPGGPELRERVQAAGYIGWSGIAENIAYGAQTPDAVVNGWINSPGHRTNMLNSQYTEIGVALSSDESGRPYWVQVFGVRRSPAR